MTIINQENKLLSAYWQRSREEGNPSRLPYGYVEASSLYSASGGYIDTGLVVTADDEWIIRCRVAPNVENRGVIGGGHSKTDSNMALWLNSKGKAIEYTYGDGGADAYKVYITNVDLTQWHTYRMKLSTGEAWMDDVYQGRAASVSAVPNQRKLTLYGCWRQQNNNIVGSSFYGQISDFIVIRGGVEIAHFIPCMRMVDKYGGMYDIVRDMYFGLGGGSIPLFSVHAEWEVETNSSYAVYAKSLGNDMTIDWGDGTVQTLNTNFSTITVACSHQYPSSGTYTVILDAPYCDFHFSTSVRVQGGNIKDSTYATSVKSVKKLDGYVVPLCFCRAATNVVVQPDILKGKYCIGDWAFSGVQTRFREIPKTIAAIYTYAFEGDTSISFKNLPPRMVLIGAFAFSGCTNIGFTTFPEGLSSIEDGAFMNCEKVKFAVIPNTVTSIGQRAFYNCYDVTFSYLPASITSIGEYAFYNCDKITFTSLPSGITSIRDYTFCKCYELALTSLPTGVTSIGKAAFFDCKKITLTSLPDAITIIQDSTFKGCTLLALTHLPSNLITIRNSSFSYCGNIMLTSLPSSLTSIGNYAFESCYRMALETLSSSLASIGTGAFQFCDALIVSEIPSTVTAISGNAFLRCAMTALTIHNPLITIDSTALRSDSLLDIYVNWYEGDVANAPWGAARATVHYLGSQSSSSSGEESSSSSEESSSSGEESSSSSEVPDLHKYSVLPSGYIEADGIFDQYNSTTKPYFNTGLMSNPSVEKKWEVEFSYQGVNASGNIPLMGTGQSKTSGNFGIWADNSDATNGRKIEFIMGNGNLSGNQMCQYFYDKNVLDLFKRHKYTLNFMTKSGYVDDVLVGTSPGVGTVQTPRQVVLHALWRGTSVYNSGHGTIHTVKIGDESDGGLIRHYIPATRLQDGIYGLYDLCESTSGENNTPFYRMYKSGSSLNDTMRLTYNIRFVVKIAEDGSSYTDTHNTGGKYCISGTQMNGGSATVDWGDTTISEYVSNFSSVHTYNSVGEYLVTFESESVDSFSFKNTNNFNGVSEIMEYDCKIVPTDFMNGAGTLDFDVDVIGDVLWIQSNAFKDCLSLSWTELPRTVKRIDANAFDNCGGFHIDKIPPRVNTIGDNAFRNCTSISSLTFEGDDVENISSTAFSGCNNLTVINVPWAQGAVANAPWGATNATINYNYTE